MKLIKYEFYKLYQKKVLLFIAIILFALNWFLFYNEQTDVLYKNTKEYAELQSKYSKMDPQQALNELMIQSSHLSLVSIIAGQREKGIDEAIIRNDVQYGLDALPKPISYDELITRYEGYLNNADMLQSINVANHFLIKQLQYIISYPEFINSMEEKAESMQSISVFNKDNTFAYRNIIKTISDFKDLKGISLSLGQAEGVLAVSTFKLTDYFLITLIILSGVFLFSEERESGMLNLVRSTKEGRLALALSKIVTLISVTLVCAILFYSVNFCVAENMFGFGDPGRLIQSMGIFRDAQTPMTLYEYFTFFFILKLLSLILFAVISGLFFITISNTKTTYVCIGIVLTFSFLFYQFIYPSSYINVLKYLNIFAFLDSYNLIANYTNLNIFGYPVSRGVTTIATMIIAGVICLILYLLSFTKNLNQYMYLDLSFFKKKKKIELKKGSANLLTQEIYKNLLSNKILFLFILALIIGFSNLNLKEMYFDSKQILYHYYAMQLEGEITDEKNTWMENEQQRFDNIPNQAQKLAEQMKNHQISKDDYEVESMKLSEFAQQIIGFQPAKKQYEYLVKLEEEQGIRGHFISTISSDYLFNNSARDLLTGLIYSVLLILSLGNIFCCEYNKGMINIIRSTRNGRGRLFFFKSMIAYATSFLLMVILYLPFYITLIYRYKLTDWKAPIQSIQQYGGFNINLNMTQFIIILLTLQLLTAFVMTSIMNLLSQILKKQTLTILCGMIVLTVPFIFSFISKAIFQKGSLVAGFQLYDIFTKEDSVLFAFIYFVVLILLGVITEVIAYLKFCKRGFC
ncbi:ABC transporter permease subunit [Anaerocolumna sp.]|uniref:ABC transporter permease subunit n=1 Tax=Anaerocolumna sp. TaxID=2041569 RepID=UPI0028A8CB88|nr:ABC transporter permease subunit [Anaerocolumna sp.]